MAEVNANGALRLVRVRPDRNRALEAAHQVRAEMAADRRSWRVVLALPWSALGWERPPAPGTTVHLNLAARHRVAPRVATTWHPLAFPFRDAESLAPATVAD